MANRGGSQAVLVTSGREEKIVVLYKELKKIIQENVTVEFSVAIKKIAGINVGTWYNYISNGKHKGKVSKYTVDNLSEFFNLPASIFAGEEDLSEEHKGIIIKTLKEKLQMFEERETLQPFAGEDIEILDHIKFLLKKIENTDNKILLSKTIETLKTVINIATKKKEIIEMRTKIN